MSRFPSMHLVGWQLALLLSMSARASGESMSNLLEAIVGDFDNRVQYEAQFNIEVDKTHSIQAEEQRSIAGASPADGSNGEPQFSHLGLQRRRVDVPALGEYVVYSQINRRADPSDIYRQSLQLFRKDDAGKITATNYRFTEPVAFVNILQHPKRFATVTEADLAPSLPPHCDPRWSFEGGIWVSRIDRRECVITSRRDGTPRHIQATEYVEEIRIRNEESGYTATGEMIFGLPANTYYQYDRIPAIEPSE